MNVGKVLHKPSRSTHTLVGGEASIKRDKTADGTRNRKEIVDQLTLAAGIHVDTARLQQACDDRDQRTPDGLGLILLLSISMRPSVRKSFRPSQYLAM